MEGVAAKTYKTRVKGNRHILFCTRSGEIFSKKGDFENWFEIQMAAVNH